MTADDFRLQDPSKRGRAGMSAQEEFDRAVVAVLDRKLDQAGVWSRMRAVDAIRDAIDAAEDDADLGRRVRPIIQRLAGEEIDRALTA